MLVRLCNILLFSPDCDIYFIIALNIDCGCSLEPPYLGLEAPQFSTYNLSFYGEISTEEQKRCDN